MLEFGGNAKKGQNIEVFLQVKDLHASKRDIQIVQARISCVFRLPSLLADRTTKACQAFSFGRASARRNANCAMLDKSSQVFTETRDNHTEAYRMCFGSQQWWKGVGGPAEMT